MVPLFHKTIKASTAWTLFKHYHVIPFIGCPENEGYARILFDLSINAGKIRYNMNKATWGQFIAKGKTKTGTLLIQTKDGNKFEIEMDRALFQEHHPWEWE